nr:hypothetical protein [Tanacetum cinerariifolium]
EVVLMMAKRLQPWCWRLLVEFAGGVKAPAGRDDVGGCRGCRGGCDDYDVVVVGWSAAAMVVPTVEGGSGGAWRQWVVNQIDRETGSVFGFAKKVRRKTFPAAATGGGWPEVVVMAGGRGGRWKRRPGALIILFVPISLAMVKDGILERIH